MFCGLAGKKILTGNLFDAVGVHVKQHAAVDDAAAQLEQAVEGESGNVRLAPPLPAVLHVFLKLQPPARHQCSSHFLNFVEYYHLTMKATYHISYNLKKNHS